MSEEWYSVFTLWRGSDLVSAHLNSLDKHQWSREADLCQDVNTGVKTLYCSLFSCLQNEMLTSQPTEDVLLTAALIMLSLVVIWTDTSLHCSGRNVPIPEHWTFLFLLAWGVSNSAWLSNTVVQNHAICSSFKLFISAVSRKCYVTYLEYLAMITTNGHNNIIKVNCNVIAAFRVTFYIFTAASS